MQISEKHAKGAFWIFIVAAAVIVAWYLRQHKTVSPTQGAEQTLAATLGPTGAPIVPQFQYGQQGPFQVNLSDYNVPVPQFHYSGNTSIYMPMFGFVAYGAQPLGG